VAADLAPAALLRQQVLILDAPKACPVNGDDTLLSVLVRNLIDNALRYSPAGATVQVTVSVQAAQTLLQVQDSGPGLTPAELTRLGERFYRVLGTEQAGSGLGWSIVKRIADVFGAQVQAGASELLGGLAVTVRWPLAR
jgi:two-component system sensor histidine kinase QseC